MAFVACFVSSRARVSSQRDAPVDHWDASTGVVDKTCLPGSVMWTLRNGWQCRLTQSVVLWSGVGRHTVSE